MSEFSDSLAAELNLATIGVVVEVVGNRLHAAGIADPQFVERFRAMTVPADDPEFRAFVANVQRPQPASGTLLIRLVGDDLTPDAAMTVVVDDGQCTFESDAELGGADAALTVTWAAIRRIIRNDSEPAQVGEGEVAQADGDTMLLETVRQLMLIPAVKEVLARRVTA